MSLILKGELALSRYTTLSNEEAAADLNTPRIDKLVPVTMQELREWAAENARGFHIQAAIADAGLTDQQRNAAYIFDKLLGTDTGVLDPGNALHLAMIDALIAAEAIDAADRTALATKATRQITQATELKLGVVTAGDVQRARA